MPANYVLLEKITVGATSVASVTFNNIPQTGYTDLVVNTSIREASTNSGITVVKINSVTTGYSGRQGVGSGTGAYSDTNYATSSGVGAEGTSATSGSTAGTFCNAEWYFPNYTSSTSKTISIMGVNENNTTTNYMAVGGYLSTNTSPITSLTFTGYSGNFGQYSTFYLYGIAKLGTTPVVAPKATGGQIIETDGTYWYHAFLASGTFTPAAALSCDVLVIAGGGGGGRTLDTNAFGAGGGGAGGVVYQTARSISSATILTIGAGGYYANGSNSTFATTSTITALGGGRGAGSSATAPTTGEAGGSGGGGTYNATAGGAATQGSSGGGTGYGFAGSVGNASNGVGAGGGGAGATGTSIGTGNQGGTGGAGLSTWSSWLTTTGLGVSGFIAGGGGGAGYGNGSFLGGPGGSGGGGTGGGIASPGTNAGLAGTANTGGGAGGSTSGFGTIGVAGGQGGSGLVLVRYLVA